MKRGTVIVKRTASGVDTSRWLPRLTATVERFNGNVPAVDAWIDEMTGDVGARVASARAAMLPVGRGPVGQSSFVAARAPSCPGSLGASGWVQ